MDLRDRVMPPELKQFDEALRKSGLNDNHDVDAAGLCALPALGNQRRTDDRRNCAGPVSVQDILANFRKQKVRPHSSRTNRIYPLGKTGMVLCFVDPSTMVFGSTEAVKKALERATGGAQPADQRRHDGCDEDASIPSRCGAFSTRRARRP